MPFSFRSFTANAIALATVATVVLMPATSRAADQTSDAMLAQVTGAPGATPIEKGKYLATAGDCAACHTAPNGKQFAGGLYMNTPFGPISTPNITPDKNTGIGNWTDDEFYNAFHSGTGKDGEHLYPVMPYPWFTKVTRDDVMAIKAYLFSLPPVDAPRLPNKLSFPFNIRAGLIGWDQIFLAEGTFKPDIAKSAEINRGGYLVQGLEHCGECHNGRNLLGDTAEAQPLQGGPIDSWYAPNITSDAKEGIGRYSDESVFNYLKTGTDKAMGVVVGPMAQTIHESLSQLTDADIHAIVAYLKSTAPKENATQTQKSAFRGNDPLGVQVYLNNCASCHGQDGKGVAGSVPPLAGNGAVTAAGPETVLNVILGGVEAQGTYSPMPAIGATMTDEQIANVTNYVRQTWGNEAQPSATPGNVGDLRAKTHTLMSLSLAECPKVVQPELAPIVATDEVQSKLKALKLENIVQTADDLIAKVKATAPNAKQADIINSLMIAYCPIVTQDAKLTARQKVEWFDQFGLRLYTQLVSPGKP